jgi:hypothetical protein
MPLDSFTSFSASESVHRDPIERGAGFGSGAETPRLSLSSASRMNGLAGLLSARRGNSAVRTYCPVFE